MKTQIVLASSSPRRSQLLSDIGLGFQQLNPEGVDESRVAGESPSDYVKRLSVEKAQSLASKFDDKTILIGADTVVTAPNGDLLGKPTDRADAERMLKLLQGETHQVLSGYAILRGQTKIARAILTTVQFRTLNHDAIQAYLNSNEWDGKAGAYAIQGLANAFVLSLNGSYTNVVGLPLTHLMGDLEAFLNTAYPTFSTKTADA